MSILLSSLNIKNWERSSNSAMYHWVLSHNQMTVSHSAKTVLRSVYNWPQNNTNFATFLPINTNYVKMLIDNCHWCHRAKKKHQEQCKKMNQLYYNSTRFGNPTVKWLWGADGHWVLEWCPRHKTLEFPAPYNPRGWLAACLSLAEI